MKKVFKDGVKISEIYPGEYRRDFKEALVIKNLPTGSDGCS